MTHSILQIRSNKTTFTTTRTKINTKMTLTGYETKMTMTKGSAFESVSIKKNNEEN